MSEQANQEISKTEFSDIVDNYMDEDIVIYYQRKIDNSELESEEWDEAVDNMYKYVHIVLNKALNEYTGSNVDIYKHNNQIFVKSDESIDNIPTTKDIDYINQKLFDIIGYKPIGFKYYTESNYRILVYV